MIKKIFLTTFLAISLNGLFSTPAFGSSIYVYFAGLVSTLWGSNEANQQNLPAEANDNPAQNDEAAEDKPLDQDDELQQNFERFTTILNKLNQTTRQQLSDGLRPLVVINSDITNGGMDMIRSVQQMRWFIAKLAREVTPDTARLLKKLCEVFYSIEVIMVRLL
jgi:hypothetical protein